MITAIQMADEHHIPHKAFRRALRKMHFPWHHHYDRWAVTIDSDHHKAMLAVLRTLIR